MCSQFPLEPLVARDGGVICVELRKQECFNLLELVAIPETMSWRSCVVRRFLHTTGPVNPPGTLETGGSDTWQCGCWLKYYKLIEPGTASQPQSNGSSEHHKLNHFALTSFAG
jgi:hypothetical protein